jgi:hypothetical protein
MRRGTFLVLLAGLFGCEAFIAPPGAGPFDPGTGGNNGSGGFGGTGGFGGSGGAGAGQGGGPNTSCDPSAYSAVTAASVAADFAATVHPQMIRPVNGCIACHDTNSGRQFKVTLDGTESFYMARTAGFFQDQPGTVLDRLLATDPLSHMPRGGTWTSAEIEAAATIVCQVKALDLQGGTPADEMFPPNLLQAYGGDAGSYDNTFINYTQLKSKVISVFADDWVRAGTDRFAQNIGQFGGVDFVTRFTEARAATPEFMMGLDSLAPDLCGQAATARTGPFTGLNLTNPIVDIPASTTRVYEVENNTTTRTPSNPDGGPSNGNFIGNPAYAIGFYSTATVSATVNLPAPGTYNVVVRGRGNYTGWDGGSEAEVKVGNTVIGTLTWVDETQFVDKTLSTNVATAGDTTFSVRFSNDTYVAGVTDVNLDLDKFSVVGPIGAGTGTTRETAARAQIDTIYSRLFYRPATTTELTNTYALLKDLSSLGALDTAWAGVCEALVRHPDFLFTLPPSHELANAASKKQLLLVKLSQDLLGRPPTAAEFTQLNGSSISAMADTYLASADFQKYYFERMRLRLESEGTLVSDEPARLFTYLVISGRPFHELLDGDYGVDPYFQPTTRPAYHGKTGLLTMPGYIQHKPGLPHYNYAARVMTGFMGAIFEVPPEVFDMRGSATAASTVDTTSICFVCHQNLTPLAHQRLKWEDDGTHRDVDQAGLAIDDSDRNMVSTYAYKGVGIESFSAKAVKKEVFIRRTLNSQFRLLMGREMRHSEDERVIYKTLWDTSVTSNGNLKAILKNVVLSPGYLRGTAP